jgi:hypothetical protein
LGLFEATIHQQEANRAIIPLLAGFWWANLGYIRPRKAKKGISVSA